MIIAMTAYLPSADPVRPGATEIARRTWMGVDPAQFDPQSSDFQALVSQVIISRLTAGVIGELAQLQAAGGPAVIDHKLELTFERTGPVSHLTEEA
jgi:hypothetical protein